MKNILSVIIVIAFVSVSKAQDYNDVLRYSERYESGNARTVAMSGAFGGIGANISTVGINPGGLGLFSQHGIEISTDLTFNNSKSDYWNNQIKGSKSNFSFNNFGFISNMKLPENELKASNLNFSFSLNRRNDFNNVINIEGVNPSSSMTDDFASLDNQEIYDKFYNDLAYETYLTSYDSINKSITDFRFYDTNGNLIRRYGELQSSNIRTSGDIYEYDFGLATYFGEVFSLGIAATINHINYTKAMEYRESDPDNIIPVFNEFIYSTKLDASGSGFTGKLGFLLTPHKFVRIGAAIHTPTVLYMSEVYQAEMQSFFSNPPTNETSSSSFYYSKQGEFDYTITTPFRYYANIGLILGNYGIFDIDIENIDYSSASFDSNNDPMTNANKSIQNLQNVTNLKTGLELKFGPYALRGGMAMYGNPYVNKNYNFGEYKTSFSGGFGLQTNGFYFDMAYIHTIKKNSELLYNDFDQNPVEADYTENFNRIIMTFGLKF